jgi:hypothetical protein
MPPSHRLGQSPVVEDLFDVEVEQRLAPAAGYRAAQASTSTR